MPTIETIAGIKFNIYFNEHLPPHVHAVYNDYEVLLVIKTREIFAGSLPARQLARARTWLVENEREALRIFYEYNERLRP
jgi:Domain of unknown function (DUF4160)